MRTLARAMCRSIRAIPQIVYAALWESREGPWENGVFNGNGGGIFKSVDGGKTWRQLTQRSAGQHCAGEPRDRAKRAENTLRRSPDKNDRETLSFR